MNKEMPEDAEKSQEKIPVEYRKLWLNIPLTLRRTFIVIFIVLIISAFFVIYYFTDGVEELINMSKHGVVSDK